MNKNKEEIGEKYKRIGNNFILQEFNPSDDEKELVDMIDDLDRKRGKWVEQIFKIIKLHRLLISQAEDNMRNRCVEEVNKLRMDDSCGYDWCENGCGGEGCSCHNVSFNSAIDQATQNINNLDKREMKRSKNTKPKAKPNGWEQDIKEDLYAIGAKPIHFEMNNAGVRIINKIHQAILSAEEAKVRECIEIANQEGLMFFKIGTTKEEIDRCGRIRKQMRKEIVDKLQALSLPDQEQLSNNKTDE